MHTFVAIDFETAQAARHTPCAIGMVKVVKGVITQRIFTLIRPPENKYAFHNINVHGIHAEHSDSAPEFREVYSLIRPMIHGGHVVCHNASFDLDVLYKTIAYNEIDDPELTFTFDDTLKLFGKSLDECCKECGIDLKHHDALSDAEACARLFLKYHNCECRDYIPGVNAMNTFYTNHTPITGNVLKPDLELVKDPCNPFFNKKVVITGVYDNWPDRRELATEIKKFGADIDSGVTSRTHILIAGKGSGPMKLKTMKQNIAGDCNRMILSEEEVISIMKQYAP